MDMKKLSQLGCFLSFLFLCVTVSLGQKLELSKSTLLVELESPTGWSIRIKPDGSGLLYYGANAFDCGKFAVNTFSIQEIITKIHAFIRPGTARDQDVRISTVCADAPSITVPVDDKGIPYVAELFKVAAEKSD
jgi:hypothetical protein